MKRGDKLVLRGQKMLKFTLPNPTIFIFFVLFSGVVSANSCVVLMYHHFSNTTPKSTSISPELFEQHLQYLQENNFQVLALKTMLDKLKNNTLPDKCVVLTADDASQSIASNAYPLLKKYQMPMAVFVATMATDDKRKTIMSWEKMREIQGENLQFYNHTVAHQHLLDLTPQQIKSAIHQAQSRLNQVLSVKRKILAYPYGEANIAILKQVELMGYSAFGQHSGVVSVDSDLQNLPRFPMAQHFAKMNAFKLKVNTLPMPIISQRMDTLITDNNPPTLNLTFKKSVKKSAQARFNCFANGEVELFWKSNKSVSITAKKPLTHRRSKYNCTMPIGQKGRYYWHSVQWVNPKIAE